jgi:hypothetical protein
MRRVILTIASVLASSASASAQYYDYEEESADAEGDYEAYFGEGEGAKEREPGPSSIAEAKKTGRGYRIGGGAGLHGKPKRDVHVVAEGDTLWDISTQYYGDPWRWPQVWSYNPEVTNPHWIYPLDQIRLTETTYKVDAAQTLGPDAYAKAGVPEGSEGAGLKVVGTGSETENAPTVYVDKGMMKPDTVFLRDAGYLDREALPRVGQLVGGFEEQMFLTNSDQVYIKFKENQDIRAGQQYSVFRTMHDYEREPHEQGELVRIFGTVLIRSFDREKRMARGVITEAIDPIERGLMVAKLERRFDLVAPRRNEKDVTAKIVAAIKPLSLLSYDNVVFLNVGADKGVQPGNRFFVMRKGDNWQSTLERQTPKQMGAIVDLPDYDESEYPDEVVAELRVIKVRKETTVCLIVRSDTDVFIGDTVQMRKGF